MSAVIGTENTGVDSTALGATDLGGSAPEEQREEQVQEGHEQAVQLETPPEIDVSKLDLTQPEHLREFRSSYDKVKFERDTAAQERDQARQEIETIRASQGKGVYLATDVPLEDFNPREGLTRMMEEEPEYYEAVAADFMDTHFWPEFTDQLQEIGVLDANNPADNEKIEALGSAWDVMARRMSAGQLNGESLYGVLSVLDKSPDLQQVILARLNAQQGGMPQQGQQPQYGQQSQGVQSAEVIAQQYGLDPTEPTHAQLIRQMQTDQQSRMQERIAVQREIAQRDLRLKQQQDQIDRIANEQKKIGQGSTEDAERRAEGRLTEQLETSLDTDIKERYASAIPKDRLGLLGDIKTIAKASLESNTDYKSATAKAAKWFRQASVATNPGDRDRWDKAGLDCLAVVSVHRAKAIADAAERLLGPIRRTTARANQKTAALQGARREFTGGTNAPPVPHRQPAPSGDIEATRAAIKRRWAEQQGR